MERLDQILPQSRQVEISSQTDRIANPVPVEKQRAMGDVFDRWRINQGWNPWDDRTQMAAIMSFVHTLDEYKIPAAAYGELYERVLRSRVTAIQSGKQLPNFGVELMVAEWTGPYGLKNELHEREVASGRILTTTSQTNCLRCYGTGFETVFGPDGKELGKRPGCKHEFVDESDPHSQMPEIKIDTNETAVQICRRASVAATQEWFGSAGQDGWNAASKLNRVIRYLQDTAARQKEDERYAAELALTTDTA